MEMLKTSFAGLSLKNPLIVSSCGLTNNADNNARLAQAGAAAIVLKSVFEEQIVRESQHIAQSGTHTEESDYMQAYLQAGILNEYITLIKQSKQRCDIPIIASINCNTSGNWEYFARAIVSPPFPYKCEKGADARPSALCVQKLLYRLFNNLCLRDTLGSTLCLKSCRHRFWDSHGKHGVNPLIILLLYRCRGFSLSFYLCHSSAAPLHL